MPDRVSFEERLEKVTRLSAEERAALLRLQDGPVPVAKGKLIQRDEQQVSALYLVHAGRLMAYVALDDGSRQVTNLYFSGDFVGATAAVGEVAQENVEALTASVVSLIDKAALRELMAQHPRLIALLFLLAQADRRIIADRMKSIGRQNAQKRLAAFLIEIHDRLGMIGEREEEGRFRLALTQEDIADALGLTPVHVNRTFRALEKAGLIVRDKRAITIPDVAALRDLGGATRRVQDVDLSWLTED